MKHLQEIFTGSWSITPKDFEALSALLLPCVIQGNLDQAESQLNKSMLKAYATDPTYLAGRWELDDETLPEGSVAVIELEGVLYSWNTFALERWLLMAEANEKICGVVLWINGPGGMVAHVDVVASTIQDMTKPVVTFVAGMMASAHFWIGTSADRIFVASPLCEVGSVGVMVTWASWKKYFEKNGIDVRDIYPDSADLKNHEYRALEEKGDEGPIKQQLERLHEVFSRTVADNLDVEYDPEMPLFRGQIFTGAEALKLGYVDELGSLQDAVTWVLGRATANQANQLV